ncbi:MAG: hypothetical protein ACKVOU_10815 [Cytophagales bacterium]
MKFTKNLLIFSIALLAFSGVFAQGRKLYPGQTRSRANSNIPISRKIAYPWTWTVGTGTMSYFGQLCQTGDCFIGPFKNINNFQFNLGLKYRFTNRISAGVGARYGRMSADDKNSPEGTGRPNRDISFITEIAEFSVFGHFDIIPSISRFMGDKSDQYNRRNFFVPYVIVGAGVMYFNPQILDYSTNKYVSTVGVKTFEGKNYGNVVPFVNGGIGTRIKVSEFFDIGADITYTVAFTEYLDDLGAKQAYPVGNENNAVRSLRTTAENLADPGFASGKKTAPSVGGIPEQGAGRSGNATFFDGYGVFNVHIDYTMANPVNFDSQKTHKHFQKGKGTRNHQFQRK